MLSVFWSAKGGAGVTTTTVAASLGRRHGAPALLVDLGGDLPSAVGAKDPDLGLTDWLASSADGAGLGRLEVSLTKRVSLLPLGAAEKWSAVRNAALVDLLRADHREVLVDLGVPLGCAVGTPSPMGALCDELLAAADRRWLVTRACYLALRRAARADRPCDGVVLLREPGRALDRHDVEALLGAPVVAEVDQDPAVARALDAGLLLARAPRHLVGSVGAIS